MPYFSVKSSRNLPKQSAIQSIPYYCPLHHHYIMCLSYMVLCVQLVYVWCICKQDVGNLLKVFLCVPTFLLTVAVRWEPRRSGQLAEVDSQMILGDSSLVSWCKHPIRLLNGPLLRWVAFSNLLPAASSCKSAAMTYRARFLERGSST